MKLEQLRNFLSHGAPDPLPNRTPLRAGPLSMCFEAGDLRYIKFGEREVIRRIYAAIRDRNWGTIPGVISKLDQRIGPEDFKIRYQCEHRQNEIHFVWNAEITGNADGSIHLIFDGEAKSTFLRNRIGFCVLHPIRECAGAKCRAIYGNGEKKETLFPKVIAAEQPVTALHDLVGIAHEVESGIWAELRFSGDLFETEDQRNWIDASFKTFCTPLRLPFPVEIKAGTRIRQEIELTVRGKLLGAVTPEAKCETVVTVGHTSRPMPRIGLGWSNHSPRLTRREIKRLSALNLGHLRIDLRASDRTALEQFSVAAAESLTIRTGTELAIHLDSPDTQASPGAYLALLRTIMEMGDFRPARIVLFGSADENSTPPAALAAAREAFAGFDAPLGVGTNADLYQLNLQRPPGDADFICWSMNPQVHAFDCTSIAETPEAAAQQVTSVRAYFPGKPLVVSPITFKPRFNPVATGPQAATPAGELPPGVDPRQLSLFGAAWTLAMIKAIAEAGADSVTFYETTGWCGAMETRTGSTCPEKFPSIPGIVFPLYHVLADVGEFADGKVILTESSHSLAVASLLLQKDKRSRLIVANLTGHAQNVELGNLGRNAHVRTMDLSNVHSATTKPEDFRGATRGFSGTTIELEAHAVAAIDSTND